MPIFVADRFRTNPGLLSIFACSVLAIIAGYLCVAASFEVTALLIASASIALFVALAGAGFFLMIVAAVLPYSEYLPNHLTLPLTLIMLVFAVTGPRRKLSRTLTPYVILVSWMLFRFLLAIVPQVGGADSLGSPLRLVLPVAFAFACVAYLRDSHDVIRMASITITVPLCVTLIQLAHAHGVSERLDGGVVRPATLGMLAAFLVAATWPIATAYKGKAWYPVIAGLICILLSGSRGALIAVAFCVLIPGLFARTSVNRERTRRLLAGLVVAAPFILIIFGGETISRLSEAITKGPTEYNDHITSTPIGARSVIWGIEKHTYEQADKLFKLIGGGPGASEQGVITHFRGGLADPHDEFLHFLVDYGWVGLVLFVVLLVSGLKTMRDIRASSSPLALVTSSVTIVLFILALTDNPTFFALALSVPLAAVGLAGRRIEDEHSAIATRRSIQHRSRLSPAATESSF